MSCGMCNATADMPLVCLVMENHVHSQLPAEHTVGLQLRYLRTNLITIRTCPEVLLAVVTTKVYKLSLTAHLSKSCISNVYVGRKAIFHHAPQEQGCRQTQGAGSNSASIALLKQGGSIRKWFEGDSSGLHSSQACSCHVWLLLLGGLNKLDRSRRLADAHNAQSPRCGPLSGSRQRDTTHGKPCQC